MIHQVQLLLGLALTLGLTGQAGIDDGEELTDKELAAARALIIHAATATKGVTRIDSPFTQAQTSVLLEEPLMSSGQFHLRTTPPCMLLKFDKPRPLEIRSDPTSHQIYNPRAKTAERFLFKSNALVHALTGVLTSEIAAIEEVFSISDLSTHDGSSTLTLVPREKGLRERIALFHLTIEEDTGWIQKLRYGPNSDEHVTLEFLKPVLVKTKSPFAELFDSPLPKDVRTVAHAVPKKPTPKKPTPKDPSPKR